MSFIWPAMLLALLLLPLGLAAYALLGRRRRGHGGAFGPLVVRPATRSTDRRRRIPGALLVLGFGVLLASLARPQSVVSLPTVEGTVILAFDVSGSMAATDFQPTRMEAAKAAARAFVARQPSTVAIGVVAFSDSGLAVQVPTHDQATIVAAIDRLGPERGTSVGQGILISLNAIELALNGPATNYYSNRSPDPTPEPTPVPPGTHAPALIVLISDGENNESPDPLQAARLAAERGVRIDTVGIGSAAGVTLDVNGFRVHSSLDEATLQGVADATGGTYFGAENQSDLSSIYDNLDTQLVAKPQAIEVTALFVAAGVLLLLAGALASLRWLGRLP